MECFEGAYYVKSSIRHPRLVDRGQIVGPKPPLKPKHIWAIRNRLQHDGGVRDLAIFNTAIDSKLRRCDLVTFCSATRSWRAPSDISGLRSTMPSSCPSKLISEEGRGGPAPPRAPSWVDSGCPRAYVRLAIKHRTFAPDLCNGDTVDSIEHPRSNAPMRRGKRFRFASRPVRGCRPLMRHPWRDEVPAGEIRRGGSPRGRGVRRARAPRCFGGRRACT